MLQHYYGPATTPEREAVDVTASENSATVCPRFQAELGDPGTATGTEGCGNPGGAETPERYLSIAVTAPRQPLDRAIYGSVSTEAVTGRPSAWSVP